MSDFERPRTFEPDQPPGIELLAAAIASPFPAPAAGAAVGAVTVLAASLVEKACALTADGALAAEGAAAGAMRAAALWFAETDEEAFGAIAKARRSGDDVYEAWAAAARVPLGLAESCAELARLATSLLDRANPNLRGELDTAVLLARAAGLAAARLCEIDLEAAGPSYDDEHARLRVVRAALT
jgi:formiminotetrahydrofolate cyclodeaminase